MARQCNSSMKFCATCAFWMGARETDSFGTYAKVESDMTKGKCMCPTGGFKMQERQALASCTSFKKWSVLR